MSLIVINEENDFYLKFKNYFEKDEQEYNLINRFFKNTKSKKYDLLNAHLLRTLEKSTAYINTQFKSRDNHPIELYIVPVIDEGKSSKNKTKDEGAVFYAPDPKEYIIDPRILISQNYSLGLDKGKVVAQSLFSSLGQEDFAKTIFYHETGHYLDYLLSYGLLTDVEQNKNLLSTGFLDQGEPLYQNFLNS